jgi:AcrR family transcriptional regulator
LPGEPDARAATSSTQGRGPGSTAEGRRSRDRVLQVSLDLITEVGIDQVRLAEIARRAGMSSGQVMYYFTSKEHILLETLALREHEESSQRRIALPGAAPGWPRLELFTALYLPSSLTDPVWILWMEAWARAPHNAHVSQFLDDLMRPWREDLAEIVEHGTREGTFQPLGPTGDFTLRFCAMLDGLAMLRMRQMPTLSSTRLTQLAMDSARTELEPRSRPGGQPR